MLKNSNLFPIFASDPDQKKYNYHKSETHAAFRTQANKTCNNPSCNFTGGSTLLTCFTGLKIIFKMGQEESHAVQQNQVLDDALGVEHLSY